MKHVLLVCISGKVIINFRKDLILGLIAAGCEVSVISGDNSYCGEINALGIKNLYICPVTNTSKGLFSNINYKKRIKKVIALAAPDIIFTFMVKPNVWGVRAAASYRRKVRGKRTVSIFGMVEGAGRIYAVDSFKNKILRILVNRLYRKSFRLADKFFFLNNDDIAYYQSKGILADGKGAVINGIGVNLDDFPQRPLPEGDVFLLVARLLYEKGITEFCEAAQLLKQKYPSARFQILGGEDDIKAADLQRYTAVEYLGVTDDVLGAYEACSVFVLPSYYKEGLPRTIMEAMAVGRPVITTDTSGCRDTVSDGQNGFIVPKKDWRALANAMERLVIEPELKDIMAEKSRALVQEKYDVNVINKRIISIILPQNEGKNSQYEGTNNRESGNVLPKNGSENDEYEANSTNNRALNTVLPNSDKKPPLRVLHVFNKMDCGGAESFIMNVYRNIDRDLVQFDFVVHSHEKGFFDDEIYAFFGRFFHVFRPKITRFFAYKSAWKRLLKAHPEWEIVHGHMQSTASIYLKIAAKNHRAVFAHSHTASSGKGFRGIIKSILQRPLRRLKRNANGANNMLACSKEAGEWLFGRRNVDRNNVTIIRNGIETQRFAFDEKIRESMREELGIGGGTTLIGHVGRFTAEKNHSFLIDVFARYNCLNPDSVLLLAGSGALQEAVEQKINTMGLQSKVIIFAARPDIARLYQAMDVFVLPSLYEGLGIVLLEAQACGLPCFASRGVPAEAAVTELVEFAELSEGADAWAQRILSRTYGQRQSRAESVASAGYDAKEVAALLQSAYLEV